MNPGGLGTSSRADSMRGEHHDERRRPPARTVAGVGGRARLRLSRRRHQRPARSVGPRGRPTDLHPGAARGDGRTRGCRLRQVQRQGGRVRGDVRVPARSTCSMACTTRSWTTFPWSRSSDRPSGRRWAASYQQEVDLLSLFKDVAGDYVQIVTVPEQLPNVLDRAMRIGDRRRAPTAIILHSDVQELDYSAADPRVQDGAVLASASTSRPSVPAEAACAGRPTC